jgi:aerobic-type carbon monoxide dehydrogenase small subunit (CoxS/CutS family)
MQREIRFSVNARPVSVATDEDRPLLEVIREDLRLTGTKYGCGEGECGACTVLIEGQAVRSCVTTVGEVAGERIVTIEGLAADGLHPVQQAFLDEQALQCGYCVPGQILAAGSLLNERPRPTRREIIDGMSGNLCRCCNYPRILAAVEAAARLKGEQGAAGPETEDNLDSAR